jgi:outer membrane receptor for ferrienterochelin and colicins
MRKYGYRCTLAYISFPFEVAFFPDQVSVRHDLYASFYGIKRINALLLKIIISYILLLPFSVAQSQAIKKDSAHQLATVTVVSERGMPKTDNVIDVKHIAMPVTIISKQKISMMGSRRLDEVLREQTGLAVVSDLGSGNRALGLQMQGFSAEYITVLIDGQPMAGRNNGNFDLSRISISNIERIEIIKGASSSLYGSEALGGVVNIITRQNSTKTQALVSALYGANKTLDATTEAEVPFHKGTAFLSGNFYRTNGFNVNPYLEKGSQTAPPYNSLTVQGRGRYQLNAKSTLHASGRLANRHSVMTRNYGAMPSRDKLDETDLNGMLSLDNQLQPNTRLLLRYYLTRYTSAQDVQLTSNNGVLQSDHYTETIHRFELQGSHEAWHKQLQLIGGSGIEYLATNAGDQGASGQMYNYFVYGQGNYKPVKQMSLTAGVRYDGNTLFGGKINPTAGASYALTNWMSIKAAIGKGYKSPDYRQLYQVFTNVAQGYSVIGANVFNEGVKQLQAAGLVQQVWTTANQIKDLEAETSTSYNIGVNIKPMPTLEWTINAFYNNIRNLINTQQVGIKTNGSQLFSYINIANAFTKGMETGFNFQPVKGLTIAGSYQLLYAKDRALIDSINARSPRYDTVRSYPVLRASTKKDYFGLPNRSRHMANLQLFYDIKPIGLKLSVRANYRGKYGFLDTDNNGFIDPYDVFVKGYVLLNASVQKRLLKERVTLQFTIDNITNHTDYLMPAQPGRMVLAGISWRFLSQANEK